MFTEVVDNYLLAVTVDPGSAFVQEQQTGVFDEGSCQGQSLLLPSRQVASLLMDQAVKATLGLHKLPGIGHFKAVFETLVRGIEVLIAVAYVVAETAFEEVDFLSDIGCHALNIFEVEVNDVLPVDEHFSELWFL